MTQIPATLDAEPADETATLALARAGDRQAMHRIYAGTVPLVTRFIARRVPAGEVEDLVAETYTRALGALPGYQDRGTPLRAWLLRIALNLVIDASRSGQRRTVPVAELGERIERRDHGARGRSTDPSTGWAERHDAREALRRAFATLEPAQRNAVGMRHLEGLPVAEVAVVLGISEPAVRALTYRGLAALRRALTRAGERCVPSTEEPWN